MRAQPQRGPRTRPRGSAEPGRTARLALRGSAIAFGVLLAGAVPAPATEEPAPADLRLEWPGGAREREPLKGRPGESVRIAYVVRNVGGRDAFAAIVTSHTALGRVRPDERVRPGPAAGGRLDRRLRMALAEGMRELCLEVRLQTLRADEPPEANREDNRLCCAIEIEDEPGPDRRTDRPRSKESPLFR